MVVNLKVYSDTTNQPTLFSPSTTDRGSTKETHGERSVATYQRSKTIGRRLTEDEHLPIRGKLLR